MDGFCNQNADLRLLGSLAGLSFPFLDSVCVYYCRTFYKAVRVGEEESGGHVL